MEIIQQLILIFGACLVGEALSALLPIPFPSSVLAMLLLFILLLCGVLKEKQIQKVGDFFLQNMSIFFLPSAIGIVQHWGLIQDVLLQFLLICFFTLLLTFAATAYTVIGVQKWLERRNTHAERTER